MDREGTEPPMPAPRPEVADLLKVEVPPGAKVIAVSDLHLPPVRSAVSGRSCETLARQLDAETSAITVVFAGDVVELLGSPGATATDILRAHEDLCAALMAVTARGGQVIYAIGNHDCDLAWDVKAADAVREMTGATLCLSADLVLADGRKIRVEHGHQLDPYNCFCDARAAAGSTARTRWRTRPTSLRSSVPGSSTESWAAACGG
jgi:UDP-2,3-diacylglucosamine pyrophosphatase LpxH